MINGVLLVDLFFLIGGTFMAVTLYLTSFGRTQRLWALTSGAWACWTLGLVMITHVTVPYWILWYVAYIGVVHVPVLLLSSVCAHIDRPLTRITSASIFSVSTILSFLPFLFLSSYRDVFQAGDTATYIPTAFQYMLLAHVLLLFVYAIFLLVHHAMYVAHPQRKSQDISLVIGIVSLLIICLFGILSVFTQRISLLPLYSVSILLPVVIGNMFQRIRAHYLHVTITLTLIALYLSVGGMVLVSSPEEVFANIPLLSLFLLSVCVGMYHLYTIHTNRLSREKGERLARYLANANARLRELDKQKTEFVSLATHQLRSPIAAIKGYTSMVLDGTYGKVPTKLDEPLTRVLESGKRLGMVVDDFLNVTRIEQGRLAYAFQEILLASLVEGVVNELLLMAKNKKIELQLDMSKGMSACVMGDEGKLRQAITNILDNAIKYTPSGFVKVSLATLATQKSAGITITDSGVGIPTGEQDRLFNKFSRASNANDGTVYGSGLGLYIAREIVRAHNGWIHVASEGVGKGSIFTIELPTILSKDTAQ